MIYCFEIQLKDWIFALVLLKELTCNHNVIKLFNSKELLALPKKFETGYTILSHKDVELKKQGPSAFEKHIFCSVMFVWLCACHAHRFYFSRLSILKFCIELIKYYNTFSFIIRSNKWNVDWILFFRKVCKMLIHNDPHLLILVMWK